MSVKARCPNPDCGQPYSVPEEQLGRTVVCQTCKQAFQLCAACTVSAESLARSASEGRNSRDPDPIPGPPILARSASEGNSAKGIASARTTPVVPGSRDEQACDIPSPPPVVGVQPGLIAPQVAPKPPPLLAANRETGHQHATHDSPGRQTQIELLAPPVQVFGPAPAQKKSTAREPGVPEKIGRFEVHERLGAGAFGAVYRARDPVLDREVAIKVPHASTLQSERRRARFLVEAKAAAQFRHPNIVPVYEAGQDGDIYYIASAFIEGQTLEAAMDDGQFRTAASASGSGEFLPELWRTAQESWDQPGLRKKARTLVAGLRQKRATGGVEPAGSTPQHVDFRQAAKLLMDLAGALQYAHQRGIVHRDVKPANIMLDAQGDPLVMDFGLARVDDGIAAVPEADALQDADPAPPGAHPQLGQPAVDDSKLTRDGTIMGTAAYMAPEQAWGRQDEVGPVSDQYSLGVVLYELLCGETPFSGPDSLVLSLVRTQEPDPPRKINPEIPVDLEAICVKAISKVRNRRYADCRAMAEDLRRWLAGEPVTARPVGTVERLVRWCGRNPVVAGLSATAGVLLLLVAMVSLLAYVKTSQALATAETERQRAEQSLEKETAERTRADGERQRAETALADVVKTQKERALAQIESLRRAEIGQVPFLIEGMAPFREDIGPRLKELAQQQDLSPKERLRVSLVLLSNDPQQVAYLRDRLLDAEPTELPVIRTALLPHRKTLAQPMWSIVDDSESPKGRRFRAACALAAFDPEGTGWAKASRPTVEVLVGENPLHMTAWMEALRPTARKLLPPLQKIFEDAKRSEAERSVATGILADYAADQPGVLAELIPLADPKQFAVLLPVLQTHADKAVPLLEVELARQVAADATEEEREKLGSRQANAAAALLRMKAGDKVWPVFRHSPDPTARSYLIQRAGPLGVDPKLLIARLDQEQDVSARRALLLSLGEYGEDLLPAVETVPSDTSPTREQGNTSPTRERGKGDGPPSLARRASVSRQRLIPKLLDLYRDDPDPGIHGAAEWVLRQWRQQARLKELDQPLATGKPQGKNHKPQGKNQWYLNGQGQTMVLIPGPMEFPMGSPTSETERNPGEILHRRHIGRSFAIAAKEVTRVQFERFLKANPEVRSALAEYKERYYPDPECPHGDITWYEAAAYCNWLSEQEGLPYNQWCYEPNHPYKFVEGMTPAVDYLNRKGYRLPSEAEWEYACRSGAVTSRYYGATDRLLDSYAYFQGNASDRAWPVGSLKPNDFGLFDMLGNAAEWCHDRSFKYPSGKGEDKPDNDAVTGKERRVLRGGSFNDLSRYERGAYRNGDQPTNRKSTVGFRVARTYP
ncbi:MAG: SUMF1/EgtB/PvdO family nonheme iron enzyme [Planctomycetota bacterium]|nr:SUMF1/EgtB/PvdO family nonheme iron enzyme [Planctomycetota bacterium]